MKSSSDGRDVFYCDNCVDKMAQWLEEDTENWHDWTWCDDCATERIEDGVPLTPIISPIK